MALETIADIVGELFRRLGSQDELIDATYINVTERAVNDAYFQTVLRYRHTEFEADEPVYFDSEFVDGADATCTSGDDFFTTNDPAIGALGRQIVDGAVSFGFGGSDYTVVNVQGAGPWVVTVAPHIQTDLTNADYVLVCRRYPMPTGCFFIYNLTDLSRRSSLRAYDIRFMDRGTPLISQPRYYDRLDNDIFIHPAPVYSMADGTIIPAKFRLRYAFKPEYVTGAQTLDPLPEEWQEVVIDYAFAKLLDRENESQRAAMIREAADKKAAYLKVPFYEELDDAEPSWVPVRDAW